jgi:hypothetical protein
VRRPGIKVHAQPDADRIASTDVETAESMRFLLRFVFWMGIVLYNLPNEGAKPSKSARVTGKTANNLEADKQSWCVQDLARCITKSITQNILKSNELDGH